ncbi:MAG: hypothetical protein P8127_09870, partial [Acidobacteriota bacterium]
MRVTAWATPVAFAALAAVLGTLDAVPWPEAVLAAISVALAFVPSGWWASGSTRRRVADAWLVPVAFAMTMVGGGIMRRMVLPPLLLLAIWAVAAASWDRVPTRRQPLFAILLGLAARAATGLGLSGVENLPLLLTIAIAAGLPWMAARRWGPRAAEIAALLGGVLPWYRWPLAAVFMTALTLILGVAGRNRRSGRFPSEWVPGVGSAVLFAAALAPWPGLDMAQVFPNIGWLTWIAVIAALAVTPLLRPGAAGVVWLAVSLSFGSVQVPSPEQRAFFLTDELGQLTMSVGNGGDYVIDLDIKSEIVLADDVPLAILRYGGANHPISLDSAKGSLVWRPHGVGAATRWRASHRSSFVVPDGERPVLFRHPDLPKGVGVRVETIGAVRATPPRDWRLDRWVMAAALAVALIQLLSGAWRSAIGSVPWLLLVFGSLIMRAPVEPLRLLAERLAVDLAMASLLTAWVPACRIWLTQKRVFLAAAALFVPLALATPHLTPPLYGDEPFHLVVMDSLAEDFDFDITDNLDLEHYPQNQLYAPGRPLVHSPVLGAILFPGYLVGGRGGALALLALMGAVL